MTPSEADAMLNSCPECGTVVDVSQVGPYEKIACPSCESPLRVRRQFNHFVIRRELGEGGMSRVFVAEDTNLHREVALKILHPHFSVREDLTSRFEREAQLTASISHPNVVKVYSAGLDQNYFYIAMELVDGLSLEEIIREEGKLDEDRVLDIGIQVAQGLRAAQARGLIHRDIKPGNILLTANGVAKIVDFGLALAAGKDDEDSGVIWATPFYVPPEKLHDLPEDMRSDIYSLGATLFHALAGKPPFDADTSSLDELKVLKSSPVSLKSAAPEASSVVCGLIDKMLKNNPDKRQSGYEQLLAEMNHARTILAGGELREIEKPRSKLGLALVALALLLLGGIAVILVMGKGEADASRDQVFLEGASTSETAGDTAAKFIRARDLLINRQTEEAGRLLDELIAFPYITQPTLNWSLFNRGLCSLLEGDLEGARGPFQTIGAKGLYTDDASERELAGFFVEVSDHMKRDLPVMEEVMGEGSANSLRPIAWLAYGLKNWQHGRFEEAMTFFDAFEAAQPPKQLEWLNQYKSLLAPFRHDAGLIGKLPRPRSSMSSEAVDDCVSQLEEVRSGLQTQGSLPGLVSTRKERALALHDQLNVAMKEVDRRREEEAKQAAEVVRSRELEQFKALRESVESFRASLDFESGIEELSGARFTHPEVNRAVDDERYGWERASQFLELLVADINQYRYTGPILRRGGAAPMAGTIVSASPGEIRVKLAFGETALPLGDVSLEGLLAIAAALADAPESDAERLKRREIFVFFARLAGSEELADAAGAVLARADGAFAERWERMMNAGGRGDETEN